jgi:hypothetical protein
MSGVDKDLIEMVVRKMDKVDTLYLLQKNLGQLQTDKSEEKHDLRSRSKINLRRLTSLDIDLARRSSLGNLFPDGPDEVGASPSFKEDLFASKYVNKLNI